MEVGTDKQVRALAGQNTRMIDLRGHEVIPGIIDDHNHQFRAASLLLGGVNVNDVTSLPEMLERIHRAAEAAKPGEGVVTTGGWDVQALKEKRPPSRDELDEVSEGHPVMVRTTRGHAYLSTAAMRVLGITRDSKSFAGYPIEKDASGEPTGALQAPVGPSLPQGLQQATSKLLPHRNHEEQEQLVMRMQQQQNALGITSLRELWLSPEEMRVYQDLWRDKKLTIRVSMGITAFGSTPPRDLEQTLATWGVGTGFGDPWLRLDCVGELQVDGSVQNAFLRAPYEGGQPDNFGSLLAGATPENIRQLVSLVDRYDWRPSTHIWGDKALDVTLDAYEAAMQEQGPIRDKRWTVEHALLIHPDQMDRIQRLGILVSAQAQPYYESRRMLQMWGQERSDVAEPLRELLDHKIVVGSGSDWPSLPNNPFVNFYFYITRKTRDGGTLGAGERVSREEALRMATINNAYITFEEKIKGSIEAGKLADFVVLPADILSVPEDQILHMLPLATYAGGREVYSAVGSSF